MSPNDAVDRLVTWITCFLAQNLDLPSRSIHAHSGFHEIGVDSALGTELVFALGEHVGIDLDPTLIFDCRTVHAFAQHVQALAAARAPLTPA